MGPTFQFCYTEDIFNHLTNSCEYSFCSQVSKELSEEYERLVNPDKAQEDSKPFKVKEEPVSDVGFSMKEELEGELASGEQAPSTVVLGMSTERLVGGLEEGHSPHISGTADQNHDTVLLLLHFNTDFNSH